MQGCHSYAHQWSMQLHMTLCHPCRLTKQVGEAGRKHRAVRHAGCRSSKMPQRQYVGSIKGMHVLSSHRHSIETSPQSPMESLGWGLRQARSVRKRNGGKSVLDHADRLAGAAETLHRSRCMWYARLHASEHVSNCPHANQRAEQKVEGGRTLLPASFASLRVPRRESRAVKQRATSATRSFQVSGGWTPAVGV